MNNSSITSPNRVDFGAIRMKVNYLTILEQDVPAIRGRFNGRMTNPEVPCPRCGGSTRFRVRLDASGVMRAYCSHCMQKGMDVFDWVMWKHNLEGIREAASWLTNTPLVAGPASTKPLPPPEPPKPLNIKIATSNAESLKESHRQYLMGRGITSTWITRALLGYSSRVNRISIPCVVDKALWGIQYRILPEVERDLKAQGAKAQRFISETGSHNHQLYMANEVAKDWPFIIIVEGVLDALAMWSFGFPTCSTFQGNNAAKPWDQRWNKYLRSAQTVYIVPDNDVSGMGDLFARVKMNEISESRILRLPDEYKDVGEFIQEDITTARRRLIEWSSLPSLKVT